MKAFENKTTGIITPLELRSFKYKALYWSIVAILVVITCISLLPSLWILLSGFKDVKEIYKIPPDLFPEKIQISKLFEVWNKYKFGTSYMASFVISIGNVISCFFGIMSLKAAAYLQPHLHRFNNKYILKIEEEGGCVDGIMDANGDAEDDSGDWTECGFYDSWLN